MKLSIIIPIYKAEKYLAQCLDSIFCQEYINEDVEVICINDGSPDLSPDIVRTYQDKYYNLILIEQNNQGVSAARNQGIIQAQGDYLVFLDADDQLFDGSLSRLLDEVTYSDDSIIVCRTFKNDIEQRPWQTLFLKNNQYTAKEIIEKGYLHGSSCGCLFSRSLILDNRLCFPLDVSNGEDGFFFHSCLYYAGKMSFRDIMMYNVMGNDLSLSRLYNRERIERMANSVLIVNDHLASYLYIRERRFVLDYIRYSILSGLVNSTLYTEGVGLSFLLEKGINKNVQLEMVNSLHFLRGKMILLKKSFVMYYFFAWIITHFRKK